jgi:prepilin-type N-terminal cleavage/methylation domain-containing protein
MPRARRARRRAFSLIELLVVVGVIAILLAILLPVLGRVREAGRRTACASQLRQIGVGLTRYFNEFNALPVRAGHLDVANPHVFKFQTLEPDVSELMLKYCGPKEIFYCPNNLDREPGKWWPYTSGTIAVTYQFPFWLKASSWLVEKPNYDRLKSDRLLAADALASSDGAHHVVEQNHPRRGGDGAAGMNLLFGDGRVEWNDGRGGYVAYGWYEGLVFWHYAQY